MGGVPELQDPDRGLIFIRPQRQRSHRPLRDLYYISIPQRPILISLSEGFDRFGPRPTDGALVLHPPHAGRAAAEVAAAQEDSVVWLLQADHAELWVPPRPVAPPLRQALVRFEHAASEEGLAPGPLH